MLRELVPIRHLLNPPCGDNCGTPLAAPFEVWPNESYAVRGTAGSEYTLEFCDGYSDTTWVAGIAVAIMDSTGQAIEGSLIEYVEGCSVTWSSPFDTTYLVVISRVGDCGGENEQADNGLPTLDCGPNGANCPEITDTTCLAFEGAPYTSIRTVDCGPDCSDSEAAVFEVWSNEAYLLDVNAGVDYEFSFCENYNPAVWEALITIGIFDTVSGQAVPDVVIASEFDCSISFTANEDATYIAVISQVANCGGTTQEINNGIPVFTCNPTLAECLSDSICLAFDGDPILSLQQPSCDIACSSFIEAPLEVWTNEGYLVDGMAGMNYEFSICSGYDSTNWEALITVGIFDPLTGQAVPESQIVWEFGCSILFQAEFDTTYIIVVSEVGECGGATVINSDNGFPTLICSPELICEPDSICLEFVGDPYESLQEPPCEDLCGTPVEAVFDVWTNESYLVDGTAGSQYTFSFCEGYDPEVWEALITVGIYDEANKIAVPESQISWEFGCGDYI